MRWLLDFEVFDSYCNIFGCEKSSNMVKPVSINCSADLAPISYLIGAKFNTIVGPSLSSILIILTVLVISNLLPSVHSLFWSCLSNTVYVISKLLSPFSKIYLITTSFTITNSCNIRCKNNIISILSWIISYPTLNTILINGFNPIIYRC